PGKQAPRHREDRGSRVAAIAQVDGQVAIHRADQVEIVVAVRRGDGQVPGYGPAEHQIAVPGTEVDLGRAPDAPNQVDEVVAHHRCARHVAIDLAQEGERCPTWSKARCQVALDEP